MKVGILTFHRAYNYGAVLQAYALQEVVRSMGHNVSIIDYKPNYPSDPFKILNLRRIKRNNWYYTFRSFLVELYSLPNQVIRHKKFIYFIKQKFELSEFNAKNLKKYDCIILGSDQIWNPEVTDFKIDMVYWGIFPFEGCKAKIISYAASVGNITNIKTIQDFARKRLSELDSVSVRELEFSNYLKNLGIVNSITLDPTLIMDDSVYYKIAKEIINKEEYILLYTVAGIKNIDQYIDYLKRLYGIKVLRISSFANKINSNCIIASPEEFLGYIKNARLIVTTSFHATIFSILFKKRFISIAQRDYPNERILSLLKQLSMDSHYYEVEDILEELDESRISLICDARKLENLRKDSINYLQNSLTNLK